MEAAAAALFGDDAAVVRKGSFGERSGAGIGAGDLLLQGFARADAAETDGDIAFGEGRCGQQRGQQ
ncbi:MAG: hypothetical protein IJK35_08785 [Oscillospiraceae bacterium]|nr:hypothetical protein [Oscillospiraceae bacterium]